MTKRSIVKQIVVSSAILVVSVGGYLGLTTVQEQPKKEPPPFNPPVVEVQTLATEDITMTVNSQGVVTPAIETQLVAAVGGTVKSVSPAFVSGAVFKQGDVLAIIDDSDYVVALKLAEAKLAASKARLAEEIAKAEAAERSWQVSGRDLNNAPELLVRKPFVAEVRANEQAAAAQLQQAQRNLERTKIKAPYDGMVKARSINVGQFVSAGTKVGEIFSTDYAEVRLPVTPEELSLIDLPKVGRNKEVGAQVKLEQHFGRTVLDWEAAIERTEGVVDQQNRMHFLVAKVSDPYGLESAKDAPLKAGSFVYATLQGKTVSDLFRLPRTALYGSDKVLILKKMEDGAEVLSFRNVDVVHADQSHVFVAGDLFEGDQVSLTPVNNPVEGMRVNAELITAPVLTKQQSAGLLQD